MKHFRDKTHEQYIAPTPYYGELRNYSAITVNQEMAPRPGRQTQLTALSEVHIRKVKIQSHWML